MPISISEPSGTARAILAKVGALGFDAAGIAEPQAVRTAGRRFLEFLALGRHGDMAWLEAKAARRADPAVLWPAARSAVVVGLSYAPGRNPLAVLGRRGRGAISVYAQGRDYHTVLKGRLKHLAQFVASGHGAAVKVFVDTAPVLEKPLAAAAGLGWQGKHTNLVSRRHGSWLFLGVLLTDLALPAARPHDDHCGRCRRCLDICPTAAFPAPYQLDARRCLSYLTIEHRGTIAPEFRVAMGNRIYGCDDCLAVCPWNRFARQSRELAFAACPPADDPPLAELARLDEVGFRRRFAGSAVKRLGRARFLRNVLIAIGNSGDPGLLPVVRERLSDRSPLVRAMAVWALARLAPADDFQRARRQHGADEPDAAVRAEWNA